MDSLNQPLRILRELDSLLSQPVELVLIGRAALALGYNKPLPHFFSTMDVDSVISKEQLNAIETNFDFWKANEALNKVLESEGLYFTHIFEESQIVITPDWYSHTERITAEPFKWIQLFRPSTIDLILTKMMRNDPEDFADIDFLLNQLNLSEIDLLKPSLEKARIPKVPEIEEIYNQCKSKLLDILNT